MPKVRQTCLWRLPLCPLLVVLSSLLISPAPIAGQSAAQTGAAHQQIAVEIRNGKTGRPIWSASPYVFLGAPDPKNFEQSHRRTNFWADAHVDATGVEPREVRVWIDFIDRDRRYSANYKDFLTFDLGGHTIRNAPSYDIDKILSTGIVTPNLCSSKTEAAKPGVLTIYVIPETLKELWYY